MRVGKRHNSHFSKNLDTNMNNQLIFFQGVIFAIFLSLGACANSDQGPRYGDMAEEICKCYEPIVEFEAVTRRAIDSDNEDLLDLLSEYYEEHAQMDEKCESLWKQMIGALATDQRQTLSEILEKTCYDIATRLQQK